MFWIISHSAIISYSRHYLLFYSIEETSGVKSKIARALTADNQKALDECLKSAKYFIIKSNNYENVALSKAKVNMR